MSTIHPNIPRLYLIKISKWFNLVMPIIVLFYQSNGLDMQEIFMLKAIYSVSIVIMEIPSGWMADAWGRKKTLVFGSIIGAIGFLIYSFANGFWFFALAEIVLGIGISFISGADAAMLYDTLASRRKEKKYLFHDGRMTAMGNIAEALAGILGGLIAAYSIRAPFYFQFFVASIAIPASIGLIEPDHLTKKLDHSVKKVIKEIKLAWSSSKDLRISILLSSITGTTTLTFAWFVQPYFLAIDLPIKLYGLLWTLLNLTVALTSFLAYKFDARFRKRNVILIIIGFLTASVIFSGIFISYWGLIILFVFYLTRGLATPIFKNYINLYVTSDMRATILSVRNFIIRISFAVIGVSLGWATDTFGLSTALILLGCIYLVISIIVALPWLRKNR